MGGGRGEGTRDRVLDAAERLLRDGRPEFSMRDLAAGAGVSFATPFNTFGGKSAIMHALSARRVETMTSRFSAGSQPSDAIGRVLLAVDVAVAVMLEEPTVNRAVMGWIGMAGGPPGQAWGRSTALWAMALGSAERSDEAHRAQALERLPGQLALAFRGTLSFWTAGELSDDDLGPTAREVARALLAGAAEG